MLPTSRAFVSCVSLAVGMALAACGPEAKGDDTANDAQASESADGESDTSITDMSWLLGTYTRIETDDETTAGITNIIFHPDGTVELDGQGCSSSSTRIYQWVAVAADEVEVFQEPPAPVFVGEGSSEAYNRARVRPTDDCAIIERFFPDVSPTGAPLYRGKRCLNKLGRPDCEESRPRRCGAFDCVSESSSSD